MSRRQDRRAGQGGCLGVRRAFHAWHECPYRNLVVLIKHPASELLHGVVSNLQTAQSIYISLDIDLFVPMISIRRVSTFTRDRLQVSFGDVAAGSGSVRQSLPGSCYAD